MLDLRQQLNPEQYRAMTAPDGPALVIAAAGSGKTRTLTHRVAYLINQGVPSQRILLLTFTNKAAKEMLERTGALVGDATRGIWGGTFHSIALRFLRAYSDRLELKQGFSILGESDARDLLKRTREEQIGDARSHSAPGADLIAQAISLSSNSLRDIPAVVADRMPDWIEATDTFCAVAERYAQAKTSMGVLDFDDFLVQWYKLLRNQRDVLERYSEQFRYVLVDEYQDTSVIQSRIVDMLASRHRNLMVVGDDGQSIYSFRGAEISNILGFAKRWPDARLYPLETNYRSRPPILALANVVLANATERIPKVLRPARTGGNLPEFHVVERRADEAGFVADEIRKLRRRGIAPPHIAVLYRAHYQSTDAQLALTKQDIAYDIRSGVRFSERSHVKDVVAHLQVLTEPLDRLAWQRLLRLLGGVGPAAIDRYFTAMAASTDPLGFAFSSAALERMPVKARNEWAAMVTRLKATRSLLRKGDIAGAISAVRSQGYDRALLAEFRDANERIAELDQLAEMAASYTSLQDFLADISSLGNAGDTGGNGARIVLTSIHQAKGLEWDYVFVIGLTDGAFPSAKAMAVPGGEEEERRLFYVATTRAREQLYLSYAKQMRNDTAQASRFLNQLPPEKYRKIEVIGAGSAGNSDGSTTVQSSTRPGVFRGAAPRSFAPAPVNFAVGDSVIHSAFGHGTVLAIEKQEDGDSMVTVRFVVGEKLLQQRYARLKKAKQ